jgi:hypothetical protein
MISGYVMHAVRYGYNCDCVKCFVGCQTFCDLR